MIQRTYKLFLSALVVCFIVGCNASTAPNGTTTTQNSMVATVNGQSWSSVTLPLAGGIATKAIMNQPSTGNLTIIGASTDLTAITIVLLHPHVGVDSLGLGNTGSYETSDKKIYVTAGFGQGNINITKYDTVNRLISGTFNFTAHRVDSVSLINQTVTVTNGSFLDIGWDKP